MARKAMWWTTQTDALFLAIKQPGNSVRRRVILSPRALLAD